jgi:exo-1,4-beta-D-glucosaminidase
MSRRSRLLIAAFCALALGGIAAGATVAVTNKNSAEVDQSSLSASAANDGYIIPSWDVQSTSKVTKDPKDLSVPGLDTSSWYHANVPRCTLMACLLASGVYQEAQIFMSNNLNSVDTAQFRVPWLYRSEFSLNASKSSHYFLQTGGITSRADLYLNGALVADKSIQSGAYGGHSYDITSLAVTNGSKNALVVRVYPTDYLHDFGVSFVDWNPPPPDNGTGVWRHISVKQTGPVALGPMRATTAFASGVFGQGNGTVTLKASVQNLENRTVTVDVEGSLTRTKTSKKSRTKKQTLTLQPFATSEVSVAVTLCNPAIWWPKQWGDQPLYTGHLSVSVDSSVSDQTARTFGIRQVTHVLNSHNDSVFSINGRPFQVLGAGYSSDIFLRWDTARWTSQVQYVLDMGLNTVRLEGKLEHPEFYEVADQLGLMILAGWECCDKWEAWSYNDNLPDPVPVWSSADYATANSSIHYEAPQLQTHPSVLAFLVGSDFWPSDEAASMYVNTLKAFDWPNPILPYAATKDGYPKILTPPSLKMDGPYDWVPPNYWWDVTPATTDRLGAAFGFGSELGPGVGTPELVSLNKFLSASDLTDLWKSPNKTMLHMTTSDSDFSTRTIYNLGLWNRYGTPTSLDDYLAKAQIADYEATRAEYEAYAAMWNSPVRPATGAIYWMLNPAWPNLHWAMFDYYLRPAGAYFGTKVGGRPEHIALDPITGAVWLINRDLSITGSRQVTMDIVGVDGKSLGTVSPATTTTEPNTSKKVADLGSAINTAKSSSDVVFVRLVLKDANAAIISRNVYWLGKTVDTLDWGNSSWYHTPVSKFADLTALNKLSPATVTATATAAGSGWKVTVTNKSGVPAFFIRLSLVDASGADIVPVFWSDNYVTLLPNESIDLQVSASGGKGASVQVSGRNVAALAVQLS